MHNRYVIEQKLEAGCKIKLLTLNPESKFVEQRAREENRTCHAVETDIAGANRILNGFINEGLSARLRPNIEFRTYDTAPAYFIFSTDSVLIAGFYLRNRRGEFFPHLELEVKGGGICQVFLEHFDSLWAASEKCDGWEKEG